MDTGCSSAPLSLEHNKGSYGSTFPCFVAVRLPRRDLEPPHLLATSSLAVQIARSNTMNPISDSFSQHSNLLLPTSTAGLSPDPVVRLPSHGPRQASSSQPIFPAQNQDLGVSIGSSTGPASRRGRVVRKRNRKTLSCEQCRRRKGKSSMLQYSGFTGPRTASVLTARLLDSQVRSHQPVRALPTKALAL